MILCLDGTLIDIDAVAIGKVTGSVHYDTVGWFSGKYRHFGGNLQALSNRDGRPLYIAPFEPEATYDITAARQHIFNAVWATSLWIFADKGYQGTGPRIKTPPEGDRLNPDDDIIGEIITGVRAPTEGCNAALRHYTALKHVSLCLKAIAKIARSALVVNSLHYDPDWRTW